MSKKSLCHEGKIGACEHHCSRGTGPAEVQGAGVAECHMSQLPLTPTVYDIKLLVLSGEGICDLINMRTVACMRPMDEDPDAFPLRGPMAINHLGQGSPVHVPRTWRFYKDGELTHALESRYP